LSDIVYNNIFFKSIVNLSYDYPTKVFFLKLTTIFSSKSIMSILV